MNLSQPQEYYKTDQGIKKGATVAVWNTLFNPLNLIAAQYDRYDSVTGYHYATNIAWIHACPIENLVEITGQSTPETPTQVSARYGDVWANAYISSGVEKTADDTLAVYKVKEAKGDFDVVAAVAVVDPIP